MEFHAQNLPPTPLQTIHKKTIHSKTVNTFLHLLESYLDQEDLYFLKIKLKKDFKVFNTTGNYQIDLEHFNRVFSEFEQLINEPDLGTRLGFGHTWFKTFLKPESHAGFYINRNGQTEFSGLFPSVAATLIKHYMQISNELFDVQFFIYKDSCTLIFKPSQDGLNHQLIEIMMFGTHKYFRFLTQERLISLEFPHNHKTRNSVIYQDAYGVLPVFTEKNEYKLEYSLRGSPDSFNKIQIDSLLLLEKVYGKELPHKSFSERNRTMIRALLPLGMANREKISRIYNLSVSSLQRKLKLEDNTFSNLVLEERMALAEHYLKNSNLKLSDISDLLGYQEISHFSKAFKRWFGISPSHYVI